MSEQVYVVVRIEDQDPRNPMKVIGICRSVDVAQAMALEYFRVFSSLFEYFDDEEARVDTADPMHVFSGWADVYIKTFDLVG